MERLVYCDRAAGLERFLDRVQWIGVDGIELDITRLSEDEYHTVVELLQRTPLQARSVHYERTNMVSLQEWALFRSQLDLVVDRAEELSADTVSVHPPLVEIGTTNTVRDLQRFMVQVNRYAKEADLHVAFELTGFLHEPELVNTGFLDVDTPHLGIMVDVSEIQAGINPLLILQKLDVDVKKIRAPVTVEEMNGYLEHIDGDVVAVAERVE